MDYNDFDPEDHEYWYHFGKSFFKGCFIFGVVLLLLSILLDFFGIIDIPS